MMAEIPGYESFAKLLNSVFNIHLDDGQTVDTELVEVSELQLSPTQETFSVVFRGPNGVPLGQGIRRFQHERTGDFDLFITPVRQDKQGVYYEAIFNRLLDSTAPTA
jgi:hypothetical protein